MHIADELEIQDAYARWLAAPFLSEAEREELRAVADDPAEITDRFYRDLEFGTGGMRGILGVGSNRMNRYTVRRATQGLANYICRLDAQERGVAIAFDSRRMSREFAEETARCLAANGIRAHVFPSLRPTPMLSFAVRELRCIAGVVITASHNPPEYNGYKVYWEDGGQITSPRDREIIREVGAVQTAAEIRTMPKEQAEAAGLYCRIDGEIDRRYLDALKKQALHPEAIREEGRSLKIVYTPLHGTGNLPVRGVLKELGFEKVYVVREQELPDGDFPTVAAPNPEEPSAFSHALRLAKEVGADLVLATDPDADRLGVYAKDAEGYAAFSGNMLGALLLEYELSQRKALGTLPENGAVVTTIVSGKMSRPIADAYRVKRLETLTGFKYIGEQIRIFEEAHTHTFLFGYEESYGCLTGTHARDKDAVAAAAAVCEAAAYYRRQGLTLCEQMRKLFETYGYYREGMFSVTRKGRDGARQIAAVMERLRAAVPEQLGGFRVLEFRDYREGIRLDCAAGTKSPTGLPKSDVLYFALAEDAWCCVRPSGTEPKIKFYTGARGSDAADAARKLETLTQAVRALADPEPSEAAETPARLPDCETRGSAKQNA